MAAKLLLNQNCPDRRVYLNLLAELFVVGSTDVFQKLQGPGTAITPRGIKGRLNAQRFTGDDWNQISIGLQELELLVVTNTRQIQAVDFSVLQKQRLMR